MSGLVAGNVKELLRGLVGGIEGVIGGTVVGMDGSTVEVLKIDPNLPLEEIAQEGALASKVLDYLCHKLDGGPMDHVMLVAERRVVLLATVGRDHLVGLVLDSRGNVGKARLQLKRFVPEIASVLNAVDLARPEG